MRCLAATAPLLAMHAEPASGDSITVPGDQAQVETGPNVRGISTGADDDQVVIEGSLRAVAPDDVPLEDVGSAVTTSSGVETGAGADVVETRGSATPGTVEATALARDAQSGGASATADAAAIQAGAGDDTVTHAGDLTARATSDSQARGGLWSLLRRSVATAVSRAFGIDGGNDADALEDDGTTTVKASATTQSSDVDLRLFPRGKASVADAPTDADADAGAMRGGAGDDTLTTGADADSDVDAYASASDQGTSLSLSGLNANSVQPHAKATAWGLAGGGGDDTLHHQGALDVHAEAHVDERDTEVTAAGVTGGSGDSLPSGAEARATGLAGENGADALENDGSLEVASEGTSTHTGVAVTGPGYARPSPAGDAIAVSTGLDGGAGDDVLSNPTGHVHARARAENRSNGVAISVLGVAGTFDGKNVASATATGIAGGDGADMLGKQERAPPPPPPDPDAPALHAEASATASSYDLAIGVLQKASVKAAPEATASAKGIDGGVGDDTVVSDREMRVETSAESSATGVQIRVASPGALGKGKQSPKQPTGKARRFASFLANGFTGLSGKFLTLAGLVAENDVASEARSTGIAGGAGADGLQSEADVDARSSATSTRTGVGVSVAAGASVSASTQAVADATGIDGHGGADPIEPSLLQRISAGLPFPLPFVPPVVQPPPDLADTIENHSTIEASSTAHAISKAFGVGLSISVGSGSGSGSGGGSGGGGTTSPPSGGGPSNKKPTQKQLNSKVRVKASSTAEATAAGIRGGAGADTIDNFGSIDLAGGEAEDPRGGAHAYAEAGSVAVEIGGCKTCYAAADALTSARSSAAGIDGEQDADTITNHQTIDVLATSDSQANQVSFTTTGAAIDDVSLKFDWTDTRKAEATSAGIAGGTGADTLKNETGGTITATAESTSSVEEAAVAVKGLSLSISSSLASAEATGIDGAGGATLPDDPGSLIEFLGRTRDRLVGLLPFEIPGLAPPPPPPDLSDTIENRGQVTAVATAETKVFDLTATLKGVALSTDSLWDQGVAATARAEGIDGGDGDDTITNFSTGRIDAQADAFTRDIGASVVMQGLAATSTSAHATAEGFGMRGGAGSDHLTNDGTIVVGKQASDSDEGIHALARGYQGSLAIEGVSGAIEPIHDSGVHANAAAGGMAGDAGDDTIENHGSASALSTSRAFGLSANVTFEGVTVTDSSVQSEARASGLEGDAGADTLTNDIAIADAKLRAEANADATGVKLSAVMTGGAVTVDPFWHAGTRADAGAVGMGGGSGADTLTNGALLETPEDDGPLVTRDSRVEAEANATAWGVDVAGAVNGFAGVLASNEAVASATGMQGGEDPEAPKSKAREFVDRLTETIGDAYRRIVLGEEPVTPEADAADVVTNYGTIDARADARSRGIEVGLNDEGVAAVIDPFADTGTIADAVSRAIAGGVGNDMLFNHGNALAKADSGALGISGAFSMTGVALVSAASQATSQATGLAGGDGDDTVRNDTRDANEMLHAEATATATGLRGAVAVQGVAGAIDLFEAGTRADATAIGIDGGAGADTVTHKGALEAISNATANGVSVAGGAYGVGAAAVDWEAHARATGLRGGDDSAPGDDVLLDGVDTVINWGTIKAQATSVARGLQGTFEFGGVAASGDPAASMGADADSYAQALAGGDGDDVLANFGDLDIDADSTSWGVAADIVVYGVAAAAASRSALADARGLDGGDGADLLTQARGLFDIDADAQATSIGGTFSFGGVNVTGSPFWTDGTTSTARATGLAGGAGADDLLFGERGGPNDADGLFALTPDATIHSDAHAFGLDAAITVFGLGGAFLDTRAEADARGADGGAGVDFTENRRHVKVEADATSHTFEWSVTGIGLAAAVSPTLDVGSEAVARSIGLAGGGAPVNDDPTIRDELVNHGALDVDAVARMASNSTAIALAGWAATSTSAESDATAWGLDGDGGPSLLQNEGGLDVLSDAAATGVDVGFSIVGDSDSGGSLGMRTLSHAEAAGLHGGSGDDELVNQLGETTDPTSPFAVKAKALSTSVAVDVTGALVTAIGTEVHAESDAYGLEGDEGDDTLWNFRPMHVEAESDVRGAEVGVLIVGAGYNSVGMGRYADARATGLDGGEGNDFASNSGDVTVVANGDARATRVQAVGAGYSKVEAYTDSYAKGTGMDGDAGDDHLINRGTLDLDVDATVTTADVAATLIGSLDTSVFSSARADAEGMQGWFGNDTLENYGTITADAHAEPAQKNVEAGIISEPKSDSVSIATANAWGIAAGPGDSDVMLNHEGASIDVTASSLARAGDVRVAVLGNALGGAGAESHARAYGLYSFEGATHTENEGEIRVKAHADAEVHSTTVVVIGGSDTDPDPGILGTQEEPGLVADAGAFGVHGGLGREEIHNTSLIDVEARAHTDVDDLQVDVGGQTRLVSGAEASADAHGIRTFFDPGEPDPGEPAPPPDVGDLVVNEGALDVRAVSRANSHGKAFTLLGGASVGDADSVQLADAKAWGIETGDGDDVVVNEGSVSASADSLSSAAGNAFGLAGHHTATGAVTADATATGVDLGTGSDSLDSKKISASSVADLPVDTGSFVAIGASRSDGLSTATATATGVTGSDDNFVVSREWLSSYARSSAFVDSHSTAISSGVAANATGNAYAWGADFGDGDDGLENHGTLSARAQVTDAADAGSFTAKADAKGLSASARADARSTVRATGARMGDGADRFWNLDGATTDVYAKGRLDADSAADAASSNATSYAETSAVATGVDLGAGDDVAEIAGTFHVRSDPDVKATSYAFGVPGDARADARATGRAFGLRLGDGDDRVTLSGAAQVVADVHSEANGNGDGLGDTDGAGDARGRGHAVGIELGTGNDVVEITGTLEVNSNVTATGTGDGDAKGEGNAYAEGFGRATAIKVAEVTSDDAANDAQEIVGAGDKTIINRGTIVAKSTLSLTANGTSGPRGDDTNPQRVGDEKTFGIQTADGNDVVENYGTLETYAVGGAAGVAIDTGAGNDRVRLGADSSTLGSIRLRSGDDELEIEGGFSLAQGNVDAGAGEHDTLTFRGAGTFARDDFHDFEALRKTGAGEFRVAVNPGPTVRELRVEDGRLRIDPSMSGQIRDIRIERGDLELMQPFAFRDDGHLAVQVFPDGSSGHMLVNGLASLGGALEILRGPGVFRRDVSFDVLNASAFRGAFDDVILPPDVPLLDFELAPPSALSLAATALSPLVLSVDVQPFTSVAANRLQRSIGSYLDELLPVADGDVLAMLGEFQMLTQPSQFAAAFSSLSPDSYDAITRTGLDSARDCTRAFQRRAERLREGRGGQGEQPGAWGEGAGSFAHQDGNDGFRSYDADSAGARLGYDREIARGVVAGGGLCYGGADVNLEDGADANLDEVGGFGYASWSGEHAYLNGSAGYAHQWYDQRRKVAVGTLTGTARSDSEGDLFSAGVGSGWRLRFGGSSLEPFGSLYFLYLDENAFSESGPAGATLHVSSQRTTSLVSDLGVRFWHPVELGVGQLLPRVSAAWVHDFDVGGRDLSASLRGAPGSSFALEGQSTDHEGARVDAGLGFQRGALNVRIDYQGAFSGDARSHGVSGNLQWSF